MADMLVKLYNLPDAEPYVRKLHEQNLHIRQARPGEQRTIADWIRQRFPEEWAAERYAYAIIGWAGSFEFYQKTVGAILIEDSEPGIFRGKLVGEV